MNTSELIFIDINILRIYGTMVSILYDMGGKYWGDSSFLCGCSNFSTILLWLYDDKHTESE